MAQRVFISIGSNLGDRIANCRAAARLISESPGIRLLKESSLYENEPWGVKDQPAFINSVIEIETTLPPRELLVLLKSIETVIGRKTAGRWGPREIDLDIIFYGGGIVDEEGMTIPHPYAHERIFVLLPLAEIAPDLIHPVFKKSVSELLGAITERGWIRKIDNR